MYLCKISRVVTHGFAVANFRITATNKVIDKIEG